MFTKNNYGKAEEALGFYASILKNSRFQVFSRYKKEETPDLEGMIKYAQLVLEKQEFGIMESAQSHEFSFNEAISFIVNCSNQLEIDYYWNKLSAMPSAEQCGWLKDKYGVSWQIMPENMGELMAKNPSKTTPAMLNMKKIIIDDLINAGKQ
jgi:predicted 3-demethylubiquinone-9 3-methyltransferase (glyoxalase superfamily)